ncbi:MAG: GntR family transcriptional regulator [Sphingobium sp.]
MDEDGTATEGSLAQSHAADEPLHLLISLMREASHPLYVQLEEQIATLIVAGRLQPGVTLPPERRLAEALSVSRATVQTSYNALRLRGLLGGRGRRGSVVQAKRPARLVPGMDRLKGFTQEMEEMGRVASTRVLERTILCDRSIASLFGLRSDARFLHLVRVRSGDDQPLTVESAWYSLDVAPQLEAADPAASIYAELGRVNLPLDYCDQTIETAMPTASECAIFGFDAPLPCLLIKRRSHVKSGAMVEYVEGLFRGDAYVYRLRLPA